MANIYLSATSLDLKPYREAVYRILRMLRHDVVSMEDYVASDAYPLHKCLADVAACDVYLGVFGWRYGYIPDQDNPAGKSITELEFRQAGDSGKPRLLFLADPAVDWPDEFKDTHTGEGDAGNRIAAFRAELETVKLVSHFRSPDHLAGLVSAAVTRCLAERTPIPAGRPRVAEIRRAALNQRLDALLADCEAASRHLSYALDPVERARLSRRLPELWDEVEELEQELQGLAG